MNTERLDNIDARLERLTSVAERTVYNIATLGDKNYRIGDTIDALTDQIGRPDGTNNYLSG